MALYSSRGTPLLKGALIFKIPKLSPMPDFFMKQYVEQSPWNDLISTETPVVFRLPDDCWNYPAHCRLFQAMKTFGADASGPGGEICDGDIGWLMLTARSSDICPYEKKLGRQRVFLYSKGEAAVKFNDDSESSKCLSNTFSFFFLFLWTKKIYIRRVVA